MEDPSVTIMSRPIYEEESNQYYNFKDHRFDVGVAFLPQGDQSQEFIMPEGIGRLIMYAGKKDYNNFQNIATNETSSMQSCKM